MPRKSAVRPSIPTYNRIHDLLRSAAGHHHVRPHRSTVPVCVVVGVTALHEHGSGERSIFDLDPGAGIGETSVRQEGPATNDQTQAQLVARPRAVICRLQ